jgi:hypothetical protein
MARKLYIDTENGRFVGGLNSSIPPDLNSFFEGDTAPYELYFVRRDPSGVNAFEPQNLSGASVKLHIGPPPPSTATAYVAQQTWTNLPTTVSATIARTVEGGVAANEQQTITFSPEAYSGTFALTFPARTVALTGTVTSGIFTAAAAHGLAAQEPFVPSGLSGTAGGLTNGQTLFVAQVLNATQFTATTRPQAAAVTAFSATAVGSVGTITATSRLIPARASAAQAQSSLEAVPSIGAGNVSVVATPGREYRLGYQNAKGQVSLPAPTISTALQPVFGKTANINFNTVELANAISASASIAAVLEVEATESGKVETFAQVPVTLRNDIIASGTPTPVSTISGSASFSILSPDSSVWVITIDNDGILTASKL